MATEENTDFNWESAIDDYITNNVQRIALEVEELMTDFNKWMAEAKQMGDEGRAYITEKVEKRLKETYDLKRLPFQRKARPEVTEETTPEVTEETTPVDTEETTPEVTEETTLMDTEETTPVVTEETTPVVTEEMTPMDTEETTPEVTEETTPEVTEETTLMDTEETTPVVTEETTPVDTEETTPVVTEETTPEDTEETTPEDTEEMTPEVTEETTPEVTEETTPEVTEEMTEVQLREDDTITTSPVTEYEDLSLNSVPQLPLSPDNSGDAIQPIRSEKRRSRRVRFVNCGKFLTLFKTLATQAVIHHSKASNKDKQNKSEKSGLWKRCRNRVNPMYPSDQSSVTPSAPATVSICASIPPVLQEFIIKDVINSIPVLANDGPARPAELPEVRRFCEEEARPSAQNNKPSRWKRFWSHFNCFSCICSPVDE